MARLHSFYISNARQELNYAGKDLSKENFNKVMQDYTNSLIFDENMFDENVDEFDDNIEEDQFENLIPDKEEEKNGNPSNDEKDSILLVGDWIDLNYKIGEENEPEGVDHGDLEFNIDEILASVNKK